MNEYEQIDSVTKTEAEQRLCRADSDELCRLLIAISEIEDWQWVQGIYLKYLYSDDIWGASAAIKGLGDLVRISGCIDKRLVTEALSNLSHNNLFLQGKIEDALSDIEVFFEG